MYKPIPANGARMDALAEMLDENGLQAILESLEILAKERAANPAYSSSYAQLWTDAAGELERTCHVYAIAAI